MKFNLLIALILCIAVRNSDAALVLSGPIEIPNSASVLTGSNSVVVADATSYCFVATGPSHFMQFEVNENNDESVELWLDFYSDDVTVDMMMTGGIGGAEDLGLDPDFGSATLGTGVLTNIQPQSVHEWTLGSLTNGTQYCALIQDVRQDNNGPERIRFSAQSIAIPEPSAFFLLAIVCSGLGVWKKKFSRSAS